MRKKLNLDDIKDKLQKGKIKLTCSFCGKPHTEVNKLVAGPGVYICDECIILSFGIMSEGKQIHLTYRDDQRDIKRTVLECSIPVDTAIGKVSRCETCGEYTYSLPDSVPRCLNCNGE